MRSHSTMAACLAGLAMGGEYWFSAAPVAAATPGPEPAGTILFVGDVDDPTAIRVAAEIRASGLTVERRRDVQSSSVVLMPGLRPADAAGAIEIDSKAGQIRVWTVDPSTGQAALRSTVQAETDPAVMAMRVVEALRASLNNPRWLDPNRVIGAREPVVSRSRPQLPAANSRFGATLGPAFTSGTNAFSGAWVGLGSVYWLWKPPWGVEILGLVPLTNEYRAVTGGSAVLTFGLVAGGLRARVLAANWCALDAGAGVGTAIIHSRAVPNFAYTGADATTWTATPYARVGASASIARPVWLRAEIAGALAIPRPSFAVAGDTISWGEPLFVASLGVEVVWP
jgi:hypothetical protein